MALMWSINVTIVSLEEKDVLDSPKTVVVKSNNEKTNELQQLKRAFLQQQVKLREIENVLKISQEAVLNQKQAKQSALDELTSLRFQFGILKQKITDLRVQASEYQQNKIDEKSSLQAETRIQHLINENQFTLNKLQEALKVKEEVEVRLQELLDENQSISKNFEEVLKVKEDLEERLQTAHHHLAKKVRETTELSDRIESQGNRISELHDDVEYSRNVINNLKELLSKQTEQEKEQQLRFKESIQGAETLAISWEEKYYRLYEKLQEHESRIKELNQIEEKYRQMQVLWTSFSGILDLPSQSTNLPKMIDPSEFIAGSKKNPSEMLSADHIGHNSRRHYQNLYDISKSYN